MNRGVSRRDFLKYLGAIAGGGMLAACVPPVVPATLTPGSTSGPTSRPTWTPRPPVCATPTPISIPPPTPVGTNFDVYAYYTQFRGTADVPRGMPGFEQKGAVTRVKLDRGFGEQHAARLVGIMKKIKKAEAAAS